MKPMFLADVENKSGPGPYAEIIEQMKAAGALIPQIFHLFRYKPNVGQHLSRLSQEIMRGAVAAQRRAAGIDRGIYFGTQSVPVLNQEPRRSCGGTLGRSWQSGRGAGGLRDRAHHGCGERRCFGLSKR